MMYLKLLLISSTLVMLIGIFRGPNIWQSYFDLKENHAVLLSAVDALEEENKSLQEEIHKLKISPDYARKVLRDKYHITEENEEIIFFGN